MTFEDFCRLHGVILTRAPVPGRWMRVPTEDKPKHRNGAVKFMSTWGLAQNWATMTEPAVWRAEGEPTLVAERARELAGRARAESDLNARMAAERAEAMLSECELASHPYLAAKGFANELANVWKREADNVLVIPMRNAGGIVGAQLISPDGDKKFLFGQRSGGAEFVIGQRGMHFLCEGYATALSARQALHNLKLPYVLHVAFSAWNMKKVAARLSQGFLIADNDASGAGERVAREIGWPYWMSDSVGEDANDFAQRCGVFALAMGIKRVMLVRRGA